MTTDSDQHDSGANWKITGCLASAGAALGAANADATILYFNPEPDLIAIDTDVFAEGGLQQITIDFDYIPVSIPDKKSGGGGIDPGNLPPGFDPNNPPTDPAEIQDFIDSLGTITGVSARVEPATSEVGDSQLILRPDDFAGSRLEHASLIGGINMITAAMIDDLDQVTNALFDPDALIDNTSAYIGDATTSKKGETEGPVAFQIVPADGFALTMGIGTEVQTKEGSGKKGKGKGKDPKTSNNYGWLRYTSLDSQIILHDLGIQITQNVPIEANAVPVPASLPLLASGAAGLAIFRRRRAIKGDGQDEK